MISERLVLDSLDRRLIRLLADNPRIGVMEMARQLGVARGTAQSRLDKLVESGVIRGFGPDIDPGAMRSSFPSSVPLFWALCSVSSPPPPSPTEM